MLPLTRLRDRELIIDGYNGTVHINPAPEFRLRFQKILDGDRALSDLRPCAMNPTRRSDGVRMPLSDEYLRP
ncbi:MAG: hypothetical protein R3E54_18050 [Halioglobus sp.]